MRFQELPLAGAYLIDIEPLADDRGFFARTVCTQEFAERGLDAAFVQSSISVNHRAGVLRGLHFQTQPAEEDKLVRCVAGRVHDVIVDLRPGSVTVTRWTAVELSAERGNAIYIPKGFAHGFMTLAPESCLLYQMTVPYAPTAARGIVWDDPDLAIDWPDGEKIISQRDRDLPRLRDVAAA